MHNASLAKRAGLALLAVIAVLGALVWGWAGIHWSPAALISSILANSTCF